MLNVLHGFTEDDLAWKEALAPLPVRGHLLPGHGWRPCPAGTSHLSLAREIAGRLTGDPVDLLGYSLGGRIALSIALDFPQRLRRLVLVSCCPGIADPLERTQRRSRDERLAEWLEKDGLGPFLAYWETLPALKPGRPLPPALEESIRARRLSHDPAGLAAALRLLGQGVMEPVWDRLPTLKLPVLLVVGAADANYRPVMTRMADAIPGARLVEIPGAGHGIHREQPDALRLVVESFLRG